MYGFVSAVMLRVVVDNGVQWGDKSNWSTYSSRCGLGLGSWCGRDGGSVKIVEFETVQLTELYHHKCAAV